MDEAERAEYAEGLLALSLPLGQTALNGSGAEAPATATTAQAETLALTPEQQEKAAKLTTAMAEKFGVAKEDFRYYAPLAKTAARP